VIETKPINNTYFRELNKVIDSSDVPRATLYIRARDDAAEAVYEHTGEKKYEDGPQLTVLQNPVKTKPTNRNGASEGLVLDLGQLNDSTHVETAVGKLFQSFRDDQFQKLEWEQKKVFLKDKLPGPVQTAGTIISVISII
jgi:hypothetical protein